MIRSNVVKLPSYVVMLAAASIANAAGVRTAVAAEQVTIVVGPQAPAVERSAAEQMASQFERVFRDVHATVATSLPDDGRHFVLVGSPQTNPAVSKAIGSDWPELSDQGLVIRSLPGESVETLVVGGGSPAATLWAASELGHRLGVRYLLRRDTFPNEQRDLDLTGHDVVMEPELRVRTWLMPYDVAYGPASWSVDEQRTLLRQLAKLKFNRLIISVEPWQPFVTYEHDGISKETARLFRDGPFRVDGDTVGKKAFLGAELFENPDLAGTKTPQQTTDAGIKLMRDVIAAAREVGLSVGLGISPLEFPREFENILPGAQVGADELTVVAAVNPVAPNDTIRRLVAAKVAAYVKTYPAIDRLCLRLPVAQGGDPHSDDSLGRSTSDANGLPSLEGQVAALGFLKRLFRDESLRSRPDGTPIGLVVEGIDPRLFPNLEKAVPPGAEALIDLAVTADETDDLQQALAKVPTENVSSQLLVQLTDDNAGVLPQAVPQSAGKLMSKLSERGWQGYATGCAMTGDLDPTVYYLSRTAWDKSVTPHEAQVELWTTMTGNKPAAERLWLGWDHLEQATHLIGRNSPGFAAPVPGMLLKHYRAEPIPDWWQEAIDHDTEYFTELYRARGSIDGDAKPVLFYHAKRSEHLLEYMNAVKAVREAALAKAEGDTDAALEHLETALEQTYNSINTLADVSRYQSDRGLIALLNEYAYRPLLAEYEKLADGE